MVVVPGRHGVDHGLARVHERAVGAVEERARAGRDDDRVDGVREPELPLVKAHDRLAERQDAFGGRVVRLSGFQRLARAVEQLLRNREVPWIEVADREVADGEALRLHRADLPGDAQDLRPDDAAGERGEPGVALLGRIEVRGDVHGPAVYRLLSSRAYALVPVVSRDAPRGARRRRGRLASASLPRGADPQARRGHLLVHAVRIPVAEEDDRHRARGDGRDGGDGSRPADPPAEGALGGIGPLAALRGRRDPLPPRGPQGRRVRARADGRGSRHRHGEALRHVLAAASVQPVPDPHEIPRRDPPALRPPARPRVPHEGRVLVRRRREGSRRALPEDGRGIPAHLRALQPRVRPRGSRLGRHRRLGVAGVHGRGRLGRGRARLLGRGRLRRERREGRHGPAPRALGGGGGEAVRRGERADAGDHDDARDRPSTSGRRRRESSTR